MTQDSQRILVMGVGNPLMRDDGAGPRTVELLLNGYEFPEHVEIVDAGTMSFMIIDVLRGADHLIIVDAVKDTGEPPGTVFRMTPEEIAPNQVAHSLHDVRLVDVLQALSLMDSTPDAVAIGVQIDTIEDWVLELSPEVEKAVPVAAAAVLQELEALGVTPTPREGTDTHADIIAALRSYAPMPAPDFGVGGLPPQGVPDPGSDA